MSAHSATRVVLSLWIALLVLAALVVSSPVAEPEPAPIDPQLADVISSNMNMACQHGCPAASSAQELNTNGALGSAASPLSVFGGLILASGFLAAV